MTTTDRTRTGAVPTIYAGVTFRSRIEARWAVFMDAAGIQWTYEPEAFDLPGGKYLPDFWLPQLSAYYEVKGADPTDAELRKAQELAEVTGHGVYVAAGWIPRILMPDATEGRLAPEWVSVGDEQSIHYHGPGGVWDWCYRWCICPICGAPDIQFEGMAARHCGVSKAEPTWDHWKLIAAYAKANDAFGPEKRPASETPTNDAARDQVTEHTWKERVCSYLMDNYDRELTQADIRDALYSENPERCKGRVHKALVALVDEGLIEKTGDSRSRTYRWKVQ